ncbi:hypothetical protein BB934_01805 [Microvirga ossetica]|uniref:UvrD-like helicase C-terminal domain-containing protein n=1 Tax=Microvirga ossetica TaxID=1882682 RepID=A0A1B2EAZ2_9HYPH|nr:AAA family ATPase [Microvirga ossetica]ANY77107.1 hypothetical protein BB934_01805 [Microvirga ossetica]
MTVIVIDRILSRKPFGVIFAGRVTEGGPEGVKRLVVVAKREAMFGDPAEGEAWRVEGSFRQGPNGPQLDAARAARALPSGILIKDYIAREISGIGSDRARRLWEAYGTRLPEVLLAGDVPAIAEAMAPERPILGPRLAAALVRAWRESDAETRLVEWSQSRGIDDARLVRRISRILGEDAIERLERNPWCLVSFLPWQKVDGLGLRVAREDGIVEPEDELNRLVGAVDAAVKDLIETGATASTDRDMRARVAAKLNVSRDHRRLEAAMSAGVRNGAIVAGEYGQWRAPGCAMMEDAILARLRQLSKIPPSRGNDQPTDLEAALAGYERSAGPLHPEQRAAVMKVLCYRFACLQGGAGVGKTHTTKAICAVWEATGGKVLLAALAGKAALRLNQSTGRLARTLFRTIQELDERASILERQSDPDMDPNEYAALELRLLRLPEITPQTLVLVDEASMVDISTLHALLRRMPLGARLLMVGDDRQLPPVSFGLTFHSVVADPEITARLTVVHRQTGETGIPSFSEALRNRKMPPVPLYAGIAQDGVFLLPASSPNEISDGVARAFQELAQDEVVVVSPMNEGTAGVRSLNKNLHRLHLEANDGLEISSPLGEWFSVGEPIVHRRNDYQRGLYNGSLGVVKSIDPNTKSLVATFDGDEEGEHVFNSGETIDLSLAYALTCHRAQGSQARRIVIALMPSRLLDPSWLYTAVTRAENQVVIVGSVDTIADALKVPWAAERRRVGLRWLEGV